MADNSVLKKNYFKFNRKIIFSFNLLHRLKMVLKQTREMLPRFTHGDIIYTGILIKFKKHNAKFIKV